MTLRAGAAVGALIASLATALLAQDRGATMLILDGSGSMWGQIGGVAKIGIAREAVGRMLADWPQGRDVGRMAYGHRREGDCGDIETLIAPEPLETVAADAAMAGVTPRGDLVLFASTMGAEQTVAAFERIEIMEVE